MKKDNEKGRHDRNRKQEKKPKRRRIKKTENANRIVECKNINSTRAMEEVANELKNTKWM